MNFAISDMTIQNPFVREHLLSYLDRIQTYPNFSQDMQLRVYVNQQRDFCAFESVDFRIQFTSSAHKMIEIIKSPYDNIIVPFHAFMRAVMSC